MIGCCSATYCSECIAKLNNRCALCRKEFTSFVLPLDELLDETLTSNETLTQQQKWDSMKGMFICIFSFGILFVGYIIFMGSA